MIFDMPYINCHLVLIIAPATQAFKKLVKQPATKARRTILAKSSLRSGAMAPNPPNWIPIDKVIIEKSRGEVSLVGQDTVENVS